MQYKRIVFVPYNIHEPIYYTTHSSRWGHVLLLTTEEGICGLHFLDQPLAYYLELTKQLLGILPIRMPTRDQAYWNQKLMSSAVLPLVIQGTAFQQAIWETLCTIPAGTTCSYQTLASHLGSPRSARAAANAVAQNTIAYLIPCHRVVRKDGRLGEYRWGASRKLSLLTYEKAR